MANTPKPDKDRRTKHVILRMSPTELKAFNKLCRTHKLSHSDMLRRAISVSIGLCATILPKESLDKLGLKE